MPSQNISNPEYIKPNIPTYLEAYLNELLDKREIRLKLRDSNLRETHSSLCRWIVEQYLLDNTSYRFEHLNTYEDHVKIHDRKLDRTVFVYFKNEQLQCENCEETDCVHTKFVIKLPEVEEALKKKYWNIQALKQELGILE